MLLPVRVSVAGPGLGQGRGPAIVGDDAADREVGRRNDDQFPAGRTGQGAAADGAGGIADQAAAQPASASPTAHRDPHGAGQVQRVERLGGSDGGLRPEGETFRVPLEASVPRSPPV